MEVHYNHKKIIDQQKVLLSQVQDEPKITYPDTDGLFTLIMYDPNAVKPPWLHWLIINIPKNKIDKGRTLAKHNPPAPPKGTGEHNYIFELRKQKTSIHLEEITYRGDFSVEKFVADNDLSQPIYQISFKTEMQSGGKLNMATQRVYERCALYPYGVYVDRLYPRGIKRNRLKKWMPEIAPSTELREWFHKNPIKRWPEFKKRYVKELNHNKEAVLKLLSVYKKYKKLILLYSSEDKKYNNARVLLAYLLKVLKKN